MQLAEASTVGLAEAGGPCGGTGEWAQLRGDGARAPDWGTGQFGFGFVSGSGGCRRCRDVMREAGRDVMHDVMREAGRDVMRDVMREAGRDVMRDVICAGWWSGLLLASSRSDQLGVVCSDELQHQRASTRRRPLQLRASL